MAEERKEKSPQQGAGSSSASRRSGRGRKRRGGNKNKKPDHKSDQLAPTDGHPPKNDPPKSGRPPRPKDEPVFEHIVQRYAVSFYETFQAAKIDLETLKEKAAAVDQLNIVIRAEGDMNDPELNAIAKTKVFAGTAWALIHDRRVEDGWYNEPR